MTNIAIVGAGNVGKGLGGRLVEAGHAVAISFARERAAREAAAVLTGARAADPEAAVADCDVAILATPWGVTLDTVRRLAEPLSGKVVWDCTNPLKPDISGLEIGTDTSGGEAVQAAVPEARVVKAIPPFAEILASDRLTIAGRPPEIVVCGDDAAATATVCRLVRSIGLDALEAGPLTMARFTEPFGMLLVQLAYVQGLGPRIAAPVLREAA